MTEKRILELPLDLVDDGENVRSPAKELTKLDYGLRTSIALYGVLQAITVARAGKRYEVLYGHRRTAAARAVGLETIPAVVEDRPTELPIRQLVENENRRRVDPLDIARTIRRYLDENPGTTQAQVASKLGRSGYYVSTKLALLEMDADLQEQVAAGRINEVKATAMRKASTPATAGARPRIFALDHETSRSASTTLPLAQPSRAPGKATIGIEQGSGWIDLVVEDEAGRGIMLTISGPAARLLGLRLTQASQAAAVAS